MVHEKRRELKVTGDDRTDFVEPRHRDLRNAAFGKASIARSGHSIRGMLGHDARLQRRAKSCCRRCCSLFSITHPVSRYFDQQKAGEPGDGHETDDFKSSISLLVLLSLLTQVSLMIDPPFNNRYEISLHNTPTEKVECGSYNQEAKLMPRHLLWM